MSAVQPTAAGSSSGTDRLTPQQAMQLATDTAEILQAKAVVKADTAKQAMDIKFKLKALLALDAAALKQAQDDVTRAQTKYDSDKAAFNAGSANDTAGSVGAGVRKQVAAVLEKPALDVVT